MAYWELSRFLLFVEIWGIKSGIAQEIIFCFLVVKFLFGWSGDIMGKERKCVGKEKTFSFSFMCCVFLQ